MELKILGCSGGVGRGLRTTSMLVDKDILIDSGSGVGDLALEEMAEIRHVFLTHSHLDHIAFLPLLIDSIFDRIKTPIVVHGLEATIEAIKANIFNDVIWPNFAKLPHPDRPVVTYLEMSPGEVRVIEGRSIEMIKVNHIIPAVGYRVDSGKGSFAFTGDTTTNDSFWAGLNAHQSLDVLILEAAFPNSNRTLAEMSRHYCPQILAEDITKLDHHPKIYLSHPKAGDEKTIFEECTRLFGKEYDLVPLKGGEIITF